MICKDCKHWSSLATAHRVIGICEKQQLLEEGVHSCDMKELKDETQNDPRNNS